MSMCQKQKFKIDPKRPDPFAGTFRCVEKNPALWRFKQVTIRFKNAAAELSCNSLDLIVARFGYS